uniref:Uncharacterized protein n=1 Tax=Oryza nivara TaxID=4536 RepID=A0A0E0I9Y3_ORYNI
MASGVAGTPEGSWLPCLGGRPSQVVEPDSSGDSMAQAEPNKVPVRLMICLSKIFFRSLI